MPVTLTSPHTPSVSLAFQSLFSRRTCAATSGESKTLKKKDQGENINKEKTGKQLTSMTCEMFPARLSDFYVPSTEQATLAYKVIRRVLRIVLRYMLIVEARLYPLTIMRFKVLRRCVGRGKP
eukprot:6173928-Pleurochrysis_carterae.AAC.2